MNIVTLFLFSTFFLQEGNAAQDLFEKMVKRLDGAKAVHVEFEMVNQRGGQAREASGSLSLAEENKMRLDLVMASPRGDQKVSIISDGKKSVELQGGRQQEIDTVEGRNTLIQNMFSRLGVMVGFMIAEPSSGKDEKIKGIDEWVTLSDFKSGESEKVDGRDADVVTFLAQISIRKDKAAVKVWIDSETGLPLKRSITPYRDGKPGKDEMLETYVKIKVDENIPADRFALPPEKTEKSEKE